MRIQKILIGKLFYETLIAIDNFFFKFHFKFQKSFTFYILTKFQFMSELEFKKKVF